MSSALRTRIKHFLQRLIVIGLGLALGVTAVAWTADTIIFRYRLNSNRQAFGQVTVHSYDAISQKSGKTQFIFNPPDVETCVHALFPHAGYVPCWYLERHSEPRTDI